MSYFSTIKVTAKVSIDGHSGGNFLIIISNLKKKISTETFCYGRL